jgi:hypothetical protein
MEVPTITASYPDRSGEESFVMLMIALSPASISESFSDHFSAVPLLVA